MMKLSDGYTLMHEHITLDLSSVKKDSDCRLDCFEETVSELKKLYQSGVRNIVDVTNKGMGRNPEYISKVEELSGIQILHSTGYYKAPFLPDEVYGKSTGELAEMMIEDITNGIDKGPSRASVIGEIGTSLNEMKPEEQKVFDAAILAGIKTGRPIYTHTTLGTYGAEQAKYLIEGGIKPGKIVIGHMDLSKDLNKIKSLIEMGVYTGFDTIGKENYFPDEKRVEFLMELESLSMLDGVVLSMDLTRKSHLKYRNGIGYGYLTEVFLPMLRTAGMKESSIEQMLIGNPQKIFEQERI